MAISEQWLPIISEVISWIRENIGPSKKELKLQVSDLKKQVQGIFTAQPPIDGRRF